MLSNSKKKIRSDCFKDVHYTYGNLAIQSVLDIVEPWGIAKIVD